MTSPREQAIEDAHQAAVAEAWKLVTARNGDWTLDGEKEKRVIATRGIFEEFLLFYSGARARIDGAKMMPEKPLTHQHVKRGTRYRVIGEATLQSTLALPDDAPVVIYQGEDGRLWARPPEEFNDGRFRAMHDATPKTAPEQRSASNDDPCRLGPEWDDGSPDYCP